MGNQLHVYSLYFVQISYMYNKQGKQRSLKLYSIWVLKRRGGLLVPITFKVKGPFIHLIFTCKNQIPIISKATVLLCQINIDCYTR